MSAEQRARDSIDQAERRDPGNFYVGSCRGQLAARGFLSSAQIGALARVTTTRRRGRALDLAGGPLTWTGSGEPDTYGLGQDFDWAGGD